MCEPTPKRTFVAHMNLPQDEQLYHVWTNLTQPPSTCTSLMHILLASELGEVQESSATQSPARWYSGARSGENTIPFSPQYMTCMKSFWGPWCQCIRFKARYGSNHITKQLYQPTKPFQPTQPKAKISYNLFAFLISVDKTISYCSTTATESVICIFIWTSHAQLSF